MDWLSSVGFHPWPWHHSYFDTRSGIISAARSSVFYTRTSGNLWQPCPPGIQQSSAAINLGRKVDHEVVWYAQTAYIQTDPCSSVDMAFYLHPPPPTPASYSRLTKLWCYQLRQHFTVAVKCTHTIKIRFTQCCGLTMYSLLTDCLLFHSCSINSQLQMYSKIIHVCRSFRGKLILVLI